MHIIASTESTSVQIVRSLLVSTTLPATDWYILYKYMKDTEKIFILTDLCMWEKNKQEGKADPHGIMVVDQETGQTRYILGGSKIKFVEGDISDIASQEEYNQGTS